MLKRPAFVSVRVNEHELSLIQRASDYNGESVSTLVRRATLPLARQILAAAARVESHDQRRGDEP